MQNIVLEHIDRSTREPNKNYVFLRSCIFFNNLRVYYFFSITDSDLKFCKLTRLFLSVSCKLNGDSLFFWIGKIYINQCRISLILGEYSVFIVIIPLIFVNAVFKGEQTWQFPSRVHRFNKSSQLKFGFLECTALIKVARWNLDSCACILDVQKLSEMILLSCTVQSRKKNLTQGVMSKCDKF